MTVTVGPEGQVAVSTDKPVGTESPTSLRGQVAGELSNAQRAQQAPVDLERDKEVLHSLLGGKKFLAIGSRSEAVQIVQRDLNVWRTERGLDPLAETGVFDKQTKDAVKLFQISVAIRNDGSVGVATQDQNGKRLTGLEADGVFGIRTLYALRKVTEREDLQSFDRFKHVTHGIYDISQVPQHWQATDIPLSARQRLQDRIERAGLSPEFMAGVADIAKMCGRSTDDVLRIMSWETGGTFSPGKHRGGPDVGIIGFSPGTARELGTSSAALAKMSREEQLPYAKEYLSRRIAQFGRPEDFASLYMLVWRPARADDPSSAVIYAAGTKGAKTFRNAFDDNKDGKIEKWEVGKRVERA